MRSKRIGSFLIHRIVEIDRFTAPANSFFASVTPEMLAKAREWLDRRFIDPVTDTMTISFHSFVVQANGLNVLVDCCNGNDKTRPGQPFANKLSTSYLEGLARVGLIPADIDIVLCTQLHFDHVGWNTRLDNDRWVPTFPNARYLMGKADFDHLAAGSPLLDPTHIESFKDSVLPVVEAGQAEFLEFTADRVIGLCLGDGLVLEGAPGHTPGSVLLHARSGGGAAIFCGDVIHHPIQIAEPALAISVDWDVETAAQTRLRLIEACADNGAFLMPTHFPAPTAGRVIRTDDGFRFVFESG